MTNADKIRAMSDEELVEFIYEMIDHDWCDGSGCMIKKDGLCGWPELDCTESAQRWLGCRVDGNPSEVPTGSGGGGE